MLATWLGIYDECLETAGHYAYDVIEVRVGVRNKKNFMFGLWASYKSTPVPYENKL